MGIFGFFHNNHFTSYLRWAVKWVTFVWTGLQQDGKLKVRVEPGLFEWTKWVSGNSLPAWIPPTDLAAAHFSVDTTYRWQATQGKVQQQLSSCNEASQESCMGDDTVFPVISQGGQDMTPIS